MIRDFIVDENMDEGVTLLLRHAGYDVFSVFESARGSDDVKVLSIAASGDKILLTFDKGDFGRLIYDCGLPAPSAVVLFRIPDMPVERRPQFVVDQVTGRFDWSGRIWVIEEQRTRSRPLPG